MENTIKTKLKASLEYELLLYCTQSKIDNSIRSCMKSIISNGLNWPYILKESKKQGITCLAYNNLLPFKDSIPENIWNNMKEIFYLNLYRNIIAYQKISSIFSFCDKENLKVIPLKGIFLADSIYNNIALRATGDIDILVKREDLSMLDKILKNLGYKASVSKDLLGYAIEKSYLNSIDYFKADEETKSMLPSTLHIHWHIVNVSLPTYLYTDTIKMDRFWQAARPLKIGDANMLQFSPNHLIVYTCEHALKHSFDRLILLSDINAAIKKYKEKITWQDLIKDTIDLGMEKQVYYGLYFTKHYIGTDIPEEILSKLKPKKTCPLEKWFFYSVLRNKRNAQSCYFVYLSLVKGILNKFKFVFRTFFPPACVIALFLNLDKPKVTFRDYLLFLKKRLSRLNKI